MDNPTTYSEWYAAEDPWNGNYAAISASYASTITTAASTLIRDVADNNDMPLAFVGMARDRKTVLLHRLARLATRPGLPATPWDDRTLATYQDVQEYALHTVEFREDYLRRPDASKRIPKKELVDEAAATDPKPDTLGPYGGDAANTELLRVRPFAFVPPRYVPMFLANRLTAWQVWETVVAAIAAEGKADDCGPLLEWARAIHTKGAADDNLPLCHVELPHPIVDDPGARVQSARLTILKRDLPARFKAANVDASNDGVKELIALHKESIDEIKELKTMMRDSLTDEKSMSKASLGFAESLLNGLSISWQRTHMNRNVVADSAVGVFEWEEDLANGGKAKISETDGTPKALAWLFGKLEPGIKVEGQALGFRDVKGKLLMPVKADGMLAKGKSDGCIGLESDLAHREKGGRSYYSYAIALVEMKTSRSSLNEAQMLLQLAAVSRESVWKQATILLGTDGGESWFLLHFTVVNSISLTEYQDGRQCLNDFEDLLKSVKSRATSLESRKRAKLGAVAEGEPEQDLSGFPKTNVASLSGADGVDGGQDAVDKALENEAFLHRLANVLAESPLSGGVRPTIPEWALAKNKVPTYYS